MADIEKNPLAGSGTSERHENAPPYDLSAAVMRHFRISKVMRNLPPERQEALFRKLDAYMDDSVDSALAGKRRVALNGLIGTPGGDGYRMELVHSRPHIEESELSDLLTDDACIGLVEVMAETPEEYRAELAILLTYIPFDKLTKATREHLEPVLQDAELELKHDKSWYLCSASEGLLAEALMEGALVVANDYLLVKYNGRLTALCTRTFTTGTGVTFVEGNWYAPTDKATREELEIAFREGHGRITLETGSWMFMRPVRSADRSLLREAQHYADDAPEQLPELINGRGRVGYRSNRRDWFSREDQADYEKL